MLWFVIPRKVMFGAHTACSSLGRDLRAGTLGHIDEVAPVVAISLEVLPHRRVVVGRSLARLDEVILRTRGEEAEDE